MTKLNLLFKILFLLSVMWISNASAGPIWKEINCDSGTRVNIDNLNGDDYLFVRPPTQASQETTFQDGLSGCEFYVESSKSFILILEVVEKAVPNKKYELYVNPPSGITKRKKNVFVTHADKLIPFYFIKQESPSSDDSSLLLKIQKRDPSDNKVTLQHGSTIDLPYYYDSFAYRWNGNDNSKMERNANGFKCTTTIKVPDNTIAYFVFNRKSFKSGDYISFSTKEDGGIFYKKYTTHSYGKAYELILDGKDVTIEIKKARNSQATFEGDLYFKPAQCQYALMTTVGPSETRTFEFPSYRSQYHYLYECLYARIPPNQNVELSVNKARRGSNDQDYQEFLEVTVDGSSTILKKDTAVQKYSSKNKEWNVYFRMYRSKPRWPDYIINLTTKD